MKRPSRRLSKGRVSRKERHAGQTPLHPGHGRQLAEPGRRSGRRAPDLSRRRHLLRQRDGRLRRGLQIRRPAGRPVQVLQVGRRQCGADSHLERPGLDEVFQPGRRQAQHPPRQAGRNAGAARLPLFRRLGRRRQADRPQGLGQAVDPEPGQGALRLHPRYAEGPGPRRPDARAGAGRQRNQWRDRLQPGQGQGADQLGSATPCCSTPVSRRCATRGRRARSSRG